MSLPNVPGMRLKALNQLRCGEWRGFELEEILYVASRLGDQIAERVSDVAEVESDPLIMALSHEIEVLGVGVNEWVYAWLSPNHPAMLLAPLEMIDIAVKLTQNTWTDDDRARITRVKHAVKR